LRLLHEEKRHTVRPDCLGHLQSRRELGGCADPGVTAEDANVVDMAKRDPALLLRASE
jgi:hypothetical protein